MSDFVMPLLLALDAPSLTMSLVNIASPHGSCTELADSVEQALRGLAHLSVTRTGNTVVARTSFGHASRVLVVARLDTAPLAAEPLAYVEMGKLYGPGAAVSKGALAMVLKVASAGGFARDVTLVFSGDDSPLPDEGDFVLVAAPTRCAVVSDASDHPVVQSLVALSEVDVVPDHDALLAGFALPAAAFGPGDLSLAGRSEEYVPTADLTQSDFVLRQWLTST